MGSHCLRLALDNDCCTLYENSQHDTLCHVFSIWRPVVDTAAHSDLVACLLPVNSNHGTFVASHYKVTTVQVRCHYHLHFTGDKTEAKAL